MSREHEPDLELGLDDPRITAYALGELEGAERAALEARCAADPALQAEVEALRDLGAALERELAMPAEDVLALDQRNATLAAARAVSRWTRRRVWTWTLSAAAAVLVLVGATALLVPDLQAKKPASVSGRTSFTALFQDDGRASGPADGAPGRGDELKLREAWETEGAPAGEPPTRRDEDAAVVGAPTVRGAAGLRAPSGVAPATPAAPSPAPYVTPTSASGGGAGGSTPGIGVGGGVIVEPQAGRRLPAPPPEPAPAADPAAPPALEGKSTASYGYAASGGIWARVRLPDREGYEHPGIDPFHRVTARGGHTSTFGVDVDTAAYTNIRRMLRTGRLPHPAAVRIEEIVNYFDYGYAPPAADGKAPFARHIQIAQCPWNPKHRLARIALKGREVDAGKRPAANLVFLVDVSGSMSDEDKLPLVRTGLETLVANLRDDDRVAIVTYAASASVVLASTPGSEREAILAAIRGLQAGGSTNGAGGIQLAYAEAQKGFRQEGVNRVLLCTDGDFNVGVSDTRGLVRLITEKARTGVYLSVLGYGTGNFQDGKMEALSNAGDGNYAYVDGQAESRRVLAEQLTGTLVTIAKDVKFQIWFNPKTVAAWRLLGYENRRLAARDFNDDTKDAGDVGAGHEVTALYEIVPTGTGVPGTVDPNPFLQKGGSEAAPPADEPEPKPQALFIWRLRWKAPTGGASSLLEQNVFDGGLTFERADRDFQWAAAASAFGMLLRHSPHRGQATWDLVLELAGPAVGEDPKGRRAEFLELCKKARALGVR